MLPINFMTASLPAVAYMNLAPPRVRYVNARLDLSPFPICMSPIEVVERVHRRRKARLQQRPMWWMLPSHSSAPWSSSSLLPPPNPLPPQLLLTLLPAPTTLRAVVSSADASIVLCFFFFSSFCLVSFVFLLKSLLPFHRAVNLRQDTC